MPAFITLKRFAFLLIMIGFCLGAWFLVQGDFLHLSLTPEISKAKDIQPFMTGLVAPIFALAGTLLIFENLRNQTSQQLSNIFFGMINLHQKIAENTQGTIIGVSDLPVAASDKDFFADLSFRIYIDFTDQAVKVKNDDGSETLIDPVANTEYDSKVGLERIKGIYFHYYLIYHSTLGHYFRNMFQIVKFVDSAKITQKEKKVYVKILRAQLSNYEMLLLAYNCMCSYGAKFKPLVEKYELLKNLNFETKLSENYYKRIIDSELLIKEFPHLQKTWDAQKTA